MNDLQLSASRVLGVAPIVLLSDNTTAITNDISATWTVKIKKAGSDWTDITSGLTFTFRSPGAYDITLTTSHTDTLGDFLLMIQSPTTADYVEKYMVVSFNPLNVPVAAGSIAAAVWDEPRGSHVTAGTFGEGVSSVQGSVTGAVGSVTAAVTVGTINANVIDNNAIAASGATEIAAAVWDELRASHVGAGSFGEGVASVTGNVGGNVTGSVASVTGDVGGNVTGSVGSVVGLTPSRLDVNVSTRAQPSDVPTAATVAAAVWATVIESTHDAAGFLRMLLAVSAGPATGVGTASSVWKSINGLKNRVLGTVVAGVRTITGLDSSP